MQVHGKQAIQPLTVLILITLGIWSHILWLALVSDALLPPTVNTSIYLKSFSCCCCCCVVGINTVLRASGQGPHTQIVLGP